MLSREYTIFIGLLLIVMSIAGYLAPEFLGAVDLDIATPTIWLLTGIIALALGFVLRSVTAMRWTAGIIGALYFLWGVIAVFTFPSTGIFGLRNLLGMVIVALGALGLAVALAPAYWLRERETYAPGEANA
jgi:peptidoglycan/LPS O-acetylase OafA/YrhL